MTDEIQVETTDGRRARQYKAVMNAVLQELVSTMEEARKEGFITEFGVQMNQDGIYVLGSLTILKRW